MPGQICVHRWQARPCGLPNFASRSPDSYPSTWMRSSLTGNRSIPLSGADARSPSRLSKPATSRFSRQRLLVGTHTSDPAWRPPGLLEPQARTGRRRPAATLGPAGPPEVPAAEPARRRPPRPFHHSVRGSPGRRSCSPVSFAAQTPGYGVSGAESQVTAEGEDRS
jgi:hypothetical protein